jgi:hypothetical protein
MPKQHPTTSRPQPALDSPPFFPSLPYPNILVPGSPHPDHGQSCAPAPAEPPNRLKMYILVRDDIPLGIAMVAAAHASLATYLKFQLRPEVQSWVDGPFFKVICRVTPADFERSKTVKDHVVMTESALGHQEVAIGFMPRGVWPTVFRNFRLYT